MRVNMAVAAVAGRQARGAALLVTCVLQLLLLPHTLSQDCRAMDDRFCVYAATSRYRTIDGSCNNLGSGKRPAPASPGHSDVNRSPAAAAGLSSIHLDRERVKWGMAGACHRYRLLEPDFADFWGNEMRRARDGSELPNARTVSNLLCTQSKPHPSPRFSQMVTNWGQITGNEMTYIGNHNVVQHMDSQTPCCIKERSAEAP